MGNMAQQDFVKKQSKEWNMLNDLSKQRYLMEFQEEMERYREEKEAWKEEREFNKPKLPVTGYSLFVKTEYKKYYIKNVQDSRNAMSEIAKNWSKMSDGLKNRYKNKSSSDKERYDQEMMEYVVRLKEANREDLVPSTKKKLLKKI